MSDILVKFLTGNLDDDWERIHSHIPVLGAIVTEPGDERTYRVEKHIWPSEHYDNYVILRVNEIVEAIAEPEAEAENEN